jgi:serine/threonine protein kinase
MKMSASTISINGPKITKQQPLSKGVVEATYLSTLSHPNLVKCESITFSPSNEELIITERRLTPLPRSLPNDQRSDLLDDMIEVLAYLEANNVVHHDVIPSNMAFDAKENRYVLLDLNNCTSTSTYHRVHHCLSAPEVDGENEESDVRSDLFSLAASLVLLRSGNKSFYTFPVMDSTTISLSEQKQLFLDESLEDMLRGDPLESSLKSMLKPISSRHFPSHFAKKKYHKLLESPLAVTSSSLFVAPPFDDWISNPVYDRVRETMYRILPLGSFSDIELLVCYELACWKNFETPLINLPSTTEYLQARKDLLIKLSFKLC